MAKAGWQSFHLDVNEIPAAYADQLNRAPRRAQGYLSRPCSGVTSSAAASKRAEEHLAAGLFVRDDLALPNGEQLALLNYQFPPKSVRADAGTGKIDLLGLREDGTLAVVELKVPGNREDRRVALLEGLIYAAIVEANIEQIAAEVLAVKGRRVRLARPGILVIAAADYWSDCRTYPPTADLETLTSDIAAAIPIDTGGRVPFHPGSQVAYQDELHCKF